MSRWAQALLLVALAAGPAAAQLSPGKLSSAHAGLEGVGSCTRCHDLGKGPSPAKCLGCHAPLAARVDAGRGLHARPGHEECAACHSEHQGRDYALVHWPDGQDAFPHERTGYRLEGRHARLGCRECHGRRFAGGSAELRAAGLDPERTFLGLTAACAACHPDPHGGALNPDCRACHTQEVWRPASGFDHARTRFPLTGLHARVDCARCHRNAGAPPKDALRFTGLAHDRCTDCHRDPHATRLGASCEGCHTTAGWTAVAASAFDHDRTRFPLRGRHRQADCAACHKPGRPRSPLPHERCADCHEDRHGAAANGRPRLLACEQCHGEEGWRPSTFTLARHEQAGYRLEGAHLAVPCDGCHRPRGARSAGAAAAIRLALPHAACTDCHADPHRGRLGRFAGAAGCASCHAVQGWGQVAFDHAATRFPLEGRHASASCRACHADRPAAARAAAAPAVAFQETATACEGCHEDAHRGQFARPAAGAAAAAAATDCGRCHAPAGWRPAAFDHDDARYRLDGAHQQVACAGCHPAERDERGSFIRYKPLGTACVDCHGARPAGAGKEGS